MPELRCKDHYPRAVELSSDLCKSEEAHDKADRNGEAEVKPLYGATLVAILASCGFAAYIAYINIQERKKLERLQPLLGVVYRR